MIPPKDKAKELIARFNVWTSRHNEAVHMEYDAKQCALICVKEMHEAIADFYTEDIDMVVAKKLDYLNEVKEEINLL
jgi:hypothetical protein